MSSLIPLEGVERRAENGVKTEKVHPLEVCGDIINYAAARAIAGVVLPLTAVFERCQ